MKPHWKDRAGFAFTLLGTAVLWWQRDYMTPFGGIFADRVMITVAVLSLAALAISFLSRREAAPKKEEEAAAERTPRHWGDFGVIAALLLAWIILLRYLGFRVTGVGGFFITAWYLAGAERWKLRRIVTSLVISLAVTYLIVYVFGHILLVPLPEGILFD